MKPDVSPLLAKLEIVATQYYLESKAHDPGVKMAVRTEPWRGWKKRGRLASVMVQRKHINMFYLASEVLS